MKCKKYIYIIVVLMLLMLNVNGVYATTEGLKVNNNINVNTRLSGSFDIASDSYLTLTSKAATATSDVVDCDTIFGDKDDPTSIRYLVNDVLKIPQIAVPILIILLGSIDFGTAVLSSKEEGMKKAQTKFVKRVVIGVCIFLVPIIMDVLMVLADIVWAGTGLTGCNI